MHFKFNPSLKRVLAPDDRRLWLLRSVALRGPYMHDGSLATLRDVVDFYTRGGIDRPSRSPMINPFDLTEPIPDIPIPLREREEEPTLELNDLLHTIYDQVRYDLRIDYRREPVPPLAPDKAEWAQRLLELAGRRH